MTTLTPTDQQLHACTASAAGAAIAPVRVTAPIRLRSAALLVITDVSAVTAAVLVSGAPTWAFLLVPATLLALAVRGDHRPPVTGALDACAAAAVSASIASGLLLLAASVLAPSALPAAALGQAWLLSCGLLSAGRAAAYAGRRVHASGVPTVIVGTGPLAAELSRLLSARPTEGLRPVAHIDLDLGDPRLDDPHTLARLAREAGGEQVVLVPGAASDASIGELARACAEHGLAVVVRTAVGEAGGALAVEHAGPVALLRLHAVDAADWRLQVKYGADRLGAALLLLCVAPVFAGLALAVRLSSAGPVLFRQRRVGRDGREFEMLKFRSMRLAAVEADDPRDAPAAGVAPGGVEGPDRRTRIGTLLRSTSLDELPQLVNVLRGEMSLVGPRPERPEYVGRFTTSVARYDERHRFKAGMTGLAQVNGLRGRTSIGDRVAYDNHYVEQWSLWLDVKILLATVRAVFEPAE